MREARNGEAAMPRDGFQAKRFTKMAGKIIHGTTHARIGAHPIAARCGNMRPEQRFLQRINGELSRVGQAAVENPDHPVQGRDKAVPYLAFLQVQTLHAM